MIAFDCESTGLDHYHGTKPFFLTFCDEQGDQLFYEFDVDPLTRQPSIPKADLVEVIELLEEQDVIVGHNVKFDVHALASIGIGDWDWSKTYDTLLAGHLLASNQPHDLTSMAKSYLDVDILPFEKRLQAAVEKARGFCRRHLPTWAIAKEGRADMPSADREIWRADYWLPRTLAKHKGYPEPDPTCEHNFVDWICTECHGHEWHLVLREYGNLDSDVTMRMWPILRDEIKRQRRWPTFVEKSKQPSILFAMEQRGVTVISENLERMAADYEVDCESRAAKCRLIASRHSYDLELPKGSANNQSLHKFLFEVLKLPILDTTETGKPAFDKNVVEQYKKVLQGEQLEFVRALSGKRKRGKSLEFIDKYRRFGIPVGDDGKMLLLHSNLKGTSTATTRLSCDCPNLQQCSKQESQCEVCHGDGCEECRWSGEDIRSVRSMFGPASGREWWTADAENIELRIPAYRSGEKKLIDLFERPKDPPFYGSKHLLNFSIVYDDIWAEAVAKVGIDKAGPYCKKEYASTWYQWDKNGGLGMQYQAGQATADAAFHRLGSYVRLKSTYIDLEALNDYYVRMANKLGYVETLPDKTVDPERGYPLLCRKTEWGSAMPTVPLNYMSQGTAGWWMIKAMNRCDEQLRKWRRMNGFDGWMILTVHDELVFDFPQAADPRTDPKNSNLRKMWVLKQLMEEGGRDINIPTPVAPQYHPKTWAEGHKVRYDA